MPVHCAVPENIHSKGIGISWRWRGSLRLKHLKNCIKLNWNFQRGGGGGSLSKKSLPSGRYRYFLEIQIAQLPPVFNSPVLVYTPG